MREKKLEIENYQEINDLFAQAIELVKEQREAFIKKEASSRAVFKEVRSLLNFHEAESQLDEPIHFQVASSSVKSFDEEILCIENLQKIDDFLILKKLGSGSFGHVYLAKQISLDREVALKITPNQGREAQNMAKLDHPNIVKVYQQVVVEAQNLRLICMELIDGLDLGKLIHFWRNRPSLELSSLLEQVLEQHSTRLNSESLVNWKQISQRPLEDTLLWWLEELAKALDFAHCHEVLHLDLKPENILIDRLGRPFLLDFNISTKINQKEGELIGGTQGFMSPEQKKYIRGLSEQNLDERSDIYSLGQVAGDLVQKISCFKNLDQTVFDKLITKCTEEKPEKRFRSAFEILTYIRRLRLKRRIRREIEKKIPTFSFMGERPFATYCLAILVPQLISSFINIVYNKTFIIGHLPERGKQIFSQLVLEYNAVVYPLCVGLFLIYAWPWMQYKSDRNDHKIFQRFLRLPDMFCLAALLGWLPGSLYFPLRLRHDLGKLDSTIFLHFALSFGLSCLIALIYSYMLGKFALYRYHFLSLVPIESIEKIEEKINRHGAPKLYYVLYLTSGLIPLSGSILILFVDPQYFSVGEYQGFRILVTALILMGTFGLCLSQRLEQAYRELLKTLKARDL